MTWNEVAVWALVIVVGFLRDSGADGAERGGLIRFRLMRWVLALVLVSTAFTPLRAVQTPVPTIGPGGQLQGPFVTVFNVKSLPASLGVVNAKGDGITDDTGPIQAALNAAGACSTVGGCAGYPGLTNGAVYLPPGQYMISMTLTVPTQVRFYGAGRTVSEIAALNPGWTNPTPNALVRLGSGTAPVFGTRVETMDINAQGLPNTIDLYSQDVQDESGALHVLVRAFGVAGVNFVGRSTGVCPCTINSYILEDVDAYNGVAGAGVGYDLDGGPGGATFAPFLIGLRHSNAAFTGTPNPAGFRLQRSSYFLYGATTEYATEGVQIGGPSGSGNGLLAGVSANHDGDAVFVFSGSAQAFGVTNAAGTNLINDTPSSVVIPVAGNFYQGVYTSGSNNFIGPTTFAKQTLTYGTTVTPNVSVGNFFSLTVTDNTGFTVANPIGYSPAVGSAASGWMTIDFYNNAGVAMAIPTFGRAYRLAGTFTAPATGNHRFYQFYFNNGDGFWREISRSAADEPN